MTDWIEDGEAGSSVRAKLNTLLRPLETASVVVPVSEVVLAAPEGYYAFKFLFGDVVIYYPGSSYPTLTDPDNLAMQFSFDGGDTYESGGSDYAIQRTRGSGSTAGAIRSNDGMAYLTDIGGAFAGYAMAAEGLVYPGSASLQPYVKSDSMLGADDGEGALVIYWDNISTYFKGSAGPNRITHVRVGPYFGDGATMTCSYTWNGVPDSD